MYVIHVIYVSQKCSTMHKQFSELLIIIFTWRFTWQIPDDVSSCCFPPETDLRLNIIYLVGASGAIVQNLRKSI